MGTIKYVNSRAELLLSAKDNVITQLYFVGGRTTPPTLAPSSCTAQEEAVLKTLSSELDEYFAGTRKTFTVPVAPQGTPFRQQVWQALQTIPYGETISYKQLAEKINSPKAIRAVGGANHNNPISIIIPCHRVIGANGKLVGYGGGLDVKEFLLELESGDLCANSN